MNWILVFVFVHASADKLQADRHVEVIKTDVRFAIASECMDFAKSSSASWSMAVGDTKSSRADMDFYFGKPGSRFACLPTFQN